MINSCIFLHHLMCPIVNEYTNSFNIHKGNIHKGNAKCLTMGFQIENPTDVTSYDLLVLYFHLVII